MRALWRPRLTAWRTALLLSVLLHLVGLYLVQTARWGELDTVAFRMRLAIPLPRFEPPPLPVPAAGGGSSETGGRVTQLRAPGGPGSLPAGIVASLAPPTPGELGAAPPTALREPGFGAKAERPQFAAEHVLGGAELSRLPPAAELAIGRGDHGVSPMDLLRLVDRARANRDQAVVMVDPTSRQDLVGYINLARVKVYGAGAPPMALDALARYLRDHTGLLAQVQETEYDYFLSPDLLKAPIHFLVQGAGQRTWGERLVGFSVPEQRLLGQYLRQGGFVYCEGSNYFLEQMAGQFQAILGRDGGLFDVPVGHEVYNSYYTFGAGFPGEDKTRGPFAVENSGWYFPVRRTGAQVVAPGAGPAPQAAAATNQFAAAPAAEPPPTADLWAVTCKDRVVGLLSDLPLTLIWARSYDVTSSGEGAAPTEPALMAGVNVVAYALTARGGLTPKEDRPAWMPGRPVTSLAQPVDPGSDLATRTEHLADALDASLAVVMAPLGQPVGPGGIQIELDGRYRLESLNPALHGLLLHNVPAGRHTLAVRYDGSSRQVDVELQGGKVQTVTFALSRLGFVTRLRLQPQAEQVALAAWLRAFPDLQVDEVFLVDDRNVLDGASGR
jgi:hypothetical protein